MILRDAFLFGTRKIVMFRKSVLRETQNWKKEVKKIETDRKESLYCSPGMFKTCWKHIFKIENIKRIRLSAMKKIYSNWMLSVGMKWNVINPKKCAEVSSQEKVTKMNQRKKKKTIYEAYRFTLMKFFQQCHFSLCWCCFQLRPAYINEIERFFSFENDSS